MPLSSNERRALAARGQRLRARIVIRAGELSETAVAHVRSAFARADLIKVRISTDDRVACERAAAQLAERIPCELVQRIGRVVLLYRPAARPE